DVDQVEQLQRRLLVPAQIRMQLGVNLPFRGQDGGDGDADAYRRFRCFADARHLRGNLRAYGYFDAQRVALPGQLDRTVAIDPAVDVTLDRRGALGPAITAVPPQPPETGILELDSLRLDAHPIVFVDLRQPLRHGSVEGVLRRRQVDAQWQ